MGCLGGWPHACPAYLNKENTVISDNTNETFNHKIEIGS